MSTGLVDAVCYLGMGHVLVANMTGNIVFLGFALGGAKGLSAASFLAALGSFLLGAAMGGRLGTALEATRRRWLIAASGILAGGENPRPGRRLTSVGAMLLGGVAGALR